MHNKKIYQLASWIIVLAMIMGTTVRTKAATSAAQTAGPSIYWGAMVDGKVPSTTNMQPGGIFDTFETRSNKKMSIIHWGQPWMMSNGTWGEFQTSYYDNVRNHGSIPMINWGSHKLGAGADQADFQLRDIYNGNYDAYIQRWATAAKTWGHPFFLRFNHEMNGWWYPWGEGITSSGAIVNGNSAGDYVKAWRHVHDIFVSVGATNVTWVWNPNQIGNTSQYPALSALYPGDAYVDWTGLDAYNKYNTWAGINPLLTGSEGMTWYKNSYNEVLSVAPGKPMMLGEFASIEAGDGGAKKAAWFTDALTTQFPTNFPKIKAIVYMNWDIDASRTYSIQTSQAATDAWAAGIGSVLYATNEYASLNTFPIPALADAVIVPTATPIQPTPTPIIPSATAIEPTATPIEPTATPIQPTATAIIPSATPIEPTATPIQPTATAVIPTATPIIPSATPIELTATPIQPTATPIIPTATLIQPTATPIVPTATPIKPTATSIQPTATATTASTTLIAIADTYINSAKPASTAGGTSTTLYVDNSPVQKTFLKFDLTSLAGKTISSVELKFKTTSNGSAGSVNSLNVKFVNDVLWQEQSMSYNNTVTISSTVLGTVPANSTSKTWYLITLSASAIQPNAGGMLSVAIESTGSDALLLYSREAADKPQLVITYK